MGTRILEPLPTGLLSRSTCSSWWLWLSRTAKRRCQVSRQAARGMVWYGTVIADQDLGCDELSPTRACAFGFAEGGWTFCAGATAIGLIGYPNSNRLQAAGCGGTALLTNLPSYLMFFTLFGCAWYWSS
ncbi:hypothetical protein F4679DRAFT_533902 [Xylaria curta]|nr:hypothetical protein F4679DRAFT_533902 [Xylaria curta]